MPLSSKVLVTGGAGFIGSNLADELIRQGAEVRIIDNLVTGSLTNLEEITAISILSKATLTTTLLLTKAVQGVDVVFHEAALPSVPRSVANPLETHQACVNGTFNVLHKVSGRRRTPSGLRRVEFCLRQPEGPAKGRNDGRQTRCRRMPPQN